MEWQVALYCIIPCDTISMHRSRQHIGGFTHLSFRSFFFYLCKCGKDFSVEGEKVVSL